MFFPTIFNIYLYWGQELHKQVLQQQCLARWQIYCRVYNVAVSLCTLLWHSIIRNEKNLPQLTHAIFSKQKLVISGIKPLPKDVDRLVAILHNDCHYIVLEVNSLSARSVLAGEKLVAMYSIST
jgi:hypothetical protein